MSARNPGLSFESGISIGPVTHAPMPKNPQVLHAMGSVANPMQRAPVGAIFAKGNMGKMISRVPGQPLGNPSAMNPENKEMLNRSMLLHEGLEQKDVRKKGGFSTWQTHRSPEVILRENNMAASMPKKFQPVKDFYHGVRGMDQTRPILEGALPNFQYGQKRYSRHAIKRMGEILERKGVKPINEESLLKMLVPASSAQPEAVSAGTKALSAAPKAVPQSGSRILSGFAEKARGAGKALGKAFRFAR